MFAGKSSLELGELIRPDTKTRPNHSIALDSATVEEAHLNNEVGFMTFQNTLRMLDAEIDADISYILRNIRFLRLPPEDNQIGSVNGNGESAEDPHNVGSTLKLHRMSYMYTEKNKRPTGPIRIGSASHGFVRRPQEKQDSTRKKNIDLIIHRTTSRKLRKKA